MIAKRNRRAELKEAVEAAKANGWTVLRNDTVRRMTEHDTPQSVIDAGWYDSPVYDSLEFISFLLPSDDHLPKVFYGVAHTPWTGRKDQKISYRKCLELLAQPLTDSEVHDRQSAPPDEKSSAGNGCESCFKDDGTVTEVCDPGSYEEGGDAWPLHLCISCQDYLRV